MSCSFEWAPQFVRVALSAESDAKDAAEDGMRAKAAVALRRCTVATKGPTRRRTGSESRPLPCSVSTDPKSAAFILGVVPSMLQLPDAASRVLLMGAACQTLELPPLFI